jgi:hypothetical protein
MTIEGEIVSVMETWPLQLTIATEKGPFHVILQPEATAAQDPAALDVRELRLGNTVRVEGHPTGERGLTASAIALVAEPKAPPSSRPAMAPGQEDRKEEPAVEVPPVEMPPPFEEK